LSIIKAEKHYGIERLKVRNSMWAGYAHRNRMRSGRI
jgi:hypothetical protein